MPKILSPVFAALALAVGLALPLQASDDPKTLPPATYAQLASGKKLDKVWIGPGFSKAAGFKMPTAPDYKAELRSQELMDALPKAMASLTKPESPFTLQLAVVKVTSRTATGLFYLQGTVTVEGQIVDPDGQLVAAFITKVKSGAGGLGGAADDYRVAADRIASQIAAELR